MKKALLVVGTLTLLTLWAGIVFAGCEDDCNGPFQTCLNLCRQTAKEDSPEASKCVNHCLHGLAGCQNRCKTSGQKSENMRGVSAEPVVCDNANAVKPIMVAAKSNPCPGGVYCANGPCEHCCEWGYFYSTPCDCRCYKTSYDASASGCGSYFRCN